MEWCNLVHGNTSLHLRAFFFQAGGGHPIGVGMGMGMVEARLLVSRSQFHQRNQVLNSNESFRFIFPLSRLSSDQVQLRRDTEQRMLSLVGHHYHHDVEFCNRNISSFALQAARVALLEGRRGFFMDINIRVLMVDRYPWPVFEGGAELVDGTLILSSHGDFGEAEAAVNETLMISLEESLGGRGKFGGVPASKSSINALETRIFERHEPTSPCTVCLENFQAGVEVMSMPCTHQFHRTCLTKWLDLSHLCPLCRFPLPTLDSSES